MYAFGEGFLFVEVAPYLGAFVAGDEGGAGVLAGGEFADGGDDGVFDEGACDEVIVFAGVGVVENGGYLFKVSRAEVEGDIAEGFVGELFEGFGFEDEHLFSVEGFGANAFAGDVSPGGFDSVVLIHGGIFKCAHGCSYLFCMTLAGMHGSKQ